MNYSGFECQQIAAFAETTDDADRKVGKIRVHSELFAGKDIGQVGFDEGNAGGQESIPDRDAGVGIGRRIDNDKIDLVARSLLNTADNLAFIVGLKSLQVDAVLLRHLVQVLIDNGQGIRAVNLGFARA